jgi:hypothetical protein
VVVRVRVSFRVLSGLLFLLLAAEAGAIPRFSARYRQNCNLCHHNPTGGGMRSLYASHYLVPAEMVLRPLPAELLEKIQPQVSESIGFGTDIRTIHHLADGDRPPPELNFFQMQGDLYVRFQVGERLSAYMDRGQSSTLEIFGLAYILPWNGYVKFGRFTPAFGWKFDDHRQFTREGRSGDAYRDLFFDPPANTDVGVEVGFHPGRLALVASVINGALGMPGVPGAPGVPFDQDEDLANTAQLLYRFNLGKVGLAVGGSWWRNTEPGGLRTAAGPFWYVNLYRLTWLGEVDWSDLDPGQDARTALVTSHELSWQLVRGLDLRAIYNFADPDLDRETGFRVKTGGGIDALLTPFFGVQAMVNVYRDEPGLDVTERTYTQSELTLHLFY